jgi:hypothetical protein
VHYTVGKIRNEPACLEVPRRSKNIATTMRYIHIAGTDAADELGEIRKRMAGLL